MARRRSIPYAITQGANRPVIFVEMWAGRDVAGEPGTGHVRTFDASDWANAAAYVTELQSGRITGRY